MSKQPGQQHYSRTMGPVLSEIRGTPKQTNFKPRESMDLIKQDGCGVSYRGNARLSDWFAGQDRERFPQATSRKVNDFKCMDDYFWKFVFNSFGLWLIVDTVESKTVEKGELLYTYLFKKFCPDFSDYKWYVQNLVYCLAYTGRQKCSDEVLNPNRTSHIFLWYLINFVAIIIINIMILLDFVKKKCLPTPVRLPGKFHDQRSWSHNQWGCQEWDD